jgi:glycosyltransferase involved in cell wall biosynthesis
MERPTVATSVGGMPEAVRHEETGLLVPPGDAPALAAAIERLLGDRADARRMARAGRALMLERFTLRRTGSDLADAYARVMGC